MDIGMTAKIELSVFLCVEIEVSSILFVLLALPTSCCLKPAVLVDTIDGTCATFDAPFPILAFVDLLSADNNAPLLQRWLTKQDLPFILGPVKHLNFTLNHEKSPTMQRQVLENWSPKLVANASNSVVTLSAIFYLYFLWNVRHGMYHNQSARLKKDSPQVFT